MTLEAMLWEARVDAENSERLEAYKRHWEYYHGAQAQSLPVGDGQPNDNVVLNLGRYVIDKGASFLFGKEVEFEVPAEKPEGGGEVESDAESPAEQSLAEIWKRNRKTTFLHKGAVSGGIYGHVFVKIIPDGIEQGIPRLVSLEPENVQVFWDGDDIESVWRYRIEYVAADRQGRAVAKRQDITREETGEGEAQSWTITNWVARGGEIWKPDPEQPTVEWPWPFAPVVDCQNLPLPGAYYGLSDMEDARLQDAVNYVASKIQRILRYHAHPKTVGKGFAANEDVRISADDMLILPGIDADLFNLEMQSDLGAALEFLDRLVNWELTLGRVPNLDPAKVNVGALSGFALSILYGDLLEKTESKRRSYGDLLVELNRRLLAMAGHGDSIYVELVWADPLPTDEESEQKRDAFELDYGLASKETVRARRELDQETELERIAQEREQDAEADENIGAQVLKRFEQAAGGAPGALGGKPGAFRAPTGGRR